MAFEATRTVEIGAPIAEVFSWLVEPDKLKAWTDADSRLPADSGELHAGYRIDGSFTAPDGERRFGLEITAYDPPRELAYVETYEGGKATASYRLSEAASGTKLEAAMSADSAAPATTVPDAVRAQIAQLPEMQRKMAEEQMANAIKQMASYDAGGDPRMRGAWESKVDAELAKLKELVELVERER
jgi:uncharacterized protein YndB with AHSA1/START domain